MVLSYPERIADGHILSEFSCGKPALDYWLQNHALRNQQKGFTAVMVVHEALRVVGFYGLAPTAVIPGTLSRKVRTGQPPDPVPCLLLGQLAVDQSYSDRGIGTALLSHALRRCLTAADLIGGRALMVTAIDDAAAAFWQRQGFIPTHDDRLRLFRSIADIAASVSAANDDSL